MNKKLPSSMSVKTKTFIQNVCYKKMASVDMTQYGFMKYASPMNLMLKLVKEKLNKIFARKKGSLASSHRRRSRSRTHLRSSSKSSRTISDTKTKQVQKRKVKTEAAKKLSRPSRIKRKISVPK